MTGQAYMDTRIYERLHEDEHIRWPCARKRRGHIHITFFFYPYYLAQGTQKALG
jgi:hypothetical protein